MIPFTVLPSVWVKVCVWVFSIIMLKLVTVCLLKPEPSRQSKPIRWQNWNNGFEHFQIQPNKCLVPLWCLHDYGVTCKKNIQVYAAVSMEWLIGLEIHENDSCLRVSLVKYTSLVQCVVQFCHLIGFYFLVSVNAL